MTIAYLDPDDEITNAVARLRASKDVRVALVLPTGSRIATSRINFRLLAHEGRAHQRRVAIVAAEPGVRAVAISAGLPAYATVAEYEAALHESHGAGAADATAATAGGAAAGLGAAAGAAAPKSRRARKRSGTSRAEADAPTAPMTVPSGFAALAGAGSGPAPLGAAGRGGVPDLPVIAGRDRAGGGGLKWMWIGLSAVLVVALVVAGGWVAFNVLPTATITVVPHTQATQPVDLTVIADPAGTTVDATRGVVPAQVVTVPLTATDTFNATGTKPVDTAATGTVTFVSHDTGRAHTIPEGTQVSTQGGAVFATTKAVTVPRAIFSPPTSGRADVTIRAVATGPTGNVGAGAIDRAPAAIEAALVNFSNPVNNAAPTTGGTHTVVQVIQQADYDAALASLRATLKTQLDGASQDPTNVPAGVTLIAASAVVGTTTADQAATAVVGKQKATFTLTLSGDGTIDGVDQTQVAQVAAARLAASVPSGFQLFSSTVQTQVGPAVVSGAQISFSASATGQMAAVLDQAALLAQVRGKTVGQARTILEALGTVTIETSPFYVSSIPDDASRVTITVEPPQPTASGAPSSGTLPTLPATATPPTAAPTSAAPGPTATPSGT